MAYALNHHHSRLDGESETFIFEPRYARNGRGSPDIIAPPLKVENGQTGKGDGAPVVAYKQSNQVPAVGVRRLTPTECERLQGFPDVQKSCIIEVWETCSDRQRNYALADALSRKSPRRAASAESDESLASAWFAELSSQLRHRNDSKHAVLNVHVDCERNALAVSNHGRLLWSVSGADRPNSSHLPMPVDDFVRLVALITSTVGSETRNGKAASHLNMTPSTHPLSGRNVVALSGREIMERADDVAHDTATISRCIRSITSEAEPSSPNYAQALITLCCYVAHAIASSIPGLTLPTSSFSLSLTTSEGWTAGQSDSARYRQLGNAVTVPVIKWIGERIEKTKDN